MQKLLYKFPNKEITESEFEAYKNNEENDAFDYSGMVEKPHDEEISKKRTDAFNLF